MKFLSVFLLIALISCNALAFHYDDAEGDQVKPSPLDEEDNVPRPKKTLNTESEAKISSEKVETIEDEDDIAPPPKKADFEKSKKNQDDEEEEEEEIVKEDLSKDDSEEDDEEEESDEDDKDDPRKTGQFKKKGDVLDNEDYAADDANANVDILKADDKDDAKLQDLVLEDDKTDGNATEIKDDDDDDDDDDKDKDSDKEKEKSPSSSTSLISSFCLIILSVTCSYF